MSLTDATPEQTRKIMGDGKAEESVMKATQERLGRMAELESEVERLQAWINDLQSGMCINCVYCGHRYGPDPGTPVAMADVLKQHIEQCSKHPLSQAKAEIERLKEERDMAADACNMNIADNVSLRADLATLEQYVGNSIVMSDYKDCADMREHLERLKGQNLNCLNTILKLRKALRQAYNYMGDEHSVKSPVQLMVDMWKLLEEK